VGGVAGFLVRRVMLFLVVGAAVLALGCPGRGAWRALLGWGVGVQASQACAGELGGVQTGEQVAQGVCIGDVDAAGGGARWQAQSEQYTAASGHTARASRVGRL